MSRLDLAQNRFRAALEKLEKAAGSVGESLDHAAKLPERIADWKPSAKSCWPASRSWKTSWLLFPA